MNKVEQEQDLRERLSGELRDIATQAQNLVEVKGQDLAERTKEIRDRLAEALQTAQETLESLEEKAEEGVKSADKAIRANPYQAIGIALGIGLVVGLFMKRRG